MMLRNAPVTILSVALLAGLASAGEPEHGTTNNEISAGKRVAVGRYARTLNPDWKYLELDTRLKAGDAARGVKMTWSDVYAREKLTRWVRDEENSGPARQLWKGVPPGSAEGRRVHVSVGGGLSVPGVVAGGGGAGGGQGKRAPNWYSLAVDVDIDVDSDRDGKIASDNSSTAATAEDAIEDDKAKNPVGALVGVDGRAPLVIRKLMSAPATGGKKLSDLIEGGLYLAHINQDQGNEGEVQFYYKEGEEHKKAIDEKTKKLVAPLWKKLLAGKDVALEMEGKKPGSIELLAILSVRPKGSKDSPAQFTDRVGLAVLRADLAVSNGGADLDNGESLGAQGDPVADKEEDTPGAYLLVNWDNDDKKKDKGGFPVPDIKKTKVVGEDNLAKVQPSFGGFVPSMGFAVLKVVSGRDNISIYRGTTKGERLALTKITGEHYWNLSDKKQLADFRKIMSVGLWVEGIKASAKLRNVKLEFRYECGGVVAASDSVSLTVVMLHLGNVVCAENGLGSPSWSFGPVKERGHSAIVYKYQGKCTFLDLTDADKYLLCEQAGPTGTRALSTMSANKKGLVYFGCYTNPEDIRDDEYGYVKRLQILALSNYFLKRSKSVHYTYEKMCKSWWDYWVGSPWDTWKSWNGTLDDLAAFRCDGFAEVIYEWNGVRAWGKTTATRDFKTVDAQGNYPNLKQHNVFRWGDDPEDGAADFWAWMQPITHCGYADSYIFNHPQVYPRKADPSWTFDYTSKTLKGTFWVTGLKQQPLGVPLTAELSPPMTR